MGENGKSSTLKIVLIVLGILVLLVVLYFVFKPKTEAEKKADNTDVNSNGETVTEAYQPPAPSDNGVQNLLSAQDNILLKGMSLATNPKILTKQVPLIFSSNLRDFLSFGQYVCFRDKMDNGDIVEKFTSFTNTNATGWLTFTAPNNGIGDPNNYAVMNGVYYNQAWQRIGTNTVANGAFVPCAADVNTEYQGVKLKDIMYFLSHTTNSGDFYILKAAYYKTAQGLYFPCNFTKDLYIAVSGGNVPQLKLVNKQQTQQAVNAAA